MKDRIIKKSLVVGIIVLFLGVGFQPALANEISDVEEDCFDCQPVNRVDLLKVKLLQIRLEVVTNILMQRFGHIIEIHEKCEEISDKVTTVREMINKLNLDLPWDENPILCTILFILFIQFGLLIDIMFFISQRFPILYNIFELIAELIGELILLPIGGLWYELCWPES